HVEFSNTEIIRSLPELGLICCIAHERRTFRGHRVRPARWLRQTIAFHAALYPRQRAVHADPMAGSDKQRVTARFAAPDPGQLLAFIHQWGQRARFAGERFEFTAEPFFRHADRWHIHHQTNMAGDYKTASIQDTMTIDKH